LFFTSTVSARARLTTAGDDLADEVVNGATQSVDLAVASSNGSLTEGASGARLANTVLELGRGPVFVLCANSATGDGETLQIIDSIALCRLPLLASLACKFALFAHSVALNALTRFHVDLCRNQRATSVCVVDAKRKGRHTGAGKRRGTKEARMPTKVLWMRRLRVLRRLLRKYRQAKKIDKHIYHEFYVGSKGNKYKNKRVLIEAIHKVKAEKVKAKAIEEQSLARKEKAKIQKERKAAKKEESLKA